jgi:hypothetical protein
MRQLNVHYERGLRGPVVPGHRRRVDHRPQATPKGLGVRPSPRTKPARNAHSKQWNTFNLIHRDLNAYTKPMLTPRVACRFSPGA